MKNSAEERFKSVLIVALNDAMQLDSSNVIQGLSESLENEANTRMKDIENWKLIFKRDMISIGSLAIERMEKIYHEFDRLLKSTLRSRARFEHRIISLPEAEHAPLRMAQTFISQLDSLCKDGVHFDSDGFATGEEDRRYFKDSCLQARASLSDLLPRMKLINDGNQSEIDRLDRIDQEIIEKFNSYKKVVMQYISKKSELVSKFKEAGSKNPEEQALKELSNSNESVLLASAGKQLDPISLAKMIETTILLSYRSASVFAQEKRVQLSPMLLDMNNDDLIETKIKLHGLLVALRDLKLNMKHTPSWKADVDSHEEIQFLRDELDFILLAQAELLVLRSLNENVDISHSTLMAKKAQWNRLWLEAKSKFENSKIVGALKKAFDYIEELQ
ncbi:MAG: hypothetical protein IPK68_15500 [Bdellovibrionales bacterium]|nr:hypothetical protein [Bdellovibrionales bacterium]